MAFRLTALVLLVVSGMAAAQPVAVRSGEHENFSRLVFELSPEATWSFEKTTAGITVILEPATLRPDLAAIYDRIPRERLAGITSAEFEDRIEVLLQIECRCHAMLFESDQHALVLDIHDGPGFTAYVPERELSGPDVSEVVVAKPAKERSFTSDYTVPDIEWLAIEQVEKPETEVEHQDEILQKAQDQLVHQLGRAATHGLIEFDASAFGATGTKTQSESGAQATDDNKTIQIPNLLAHTSVDHRGRQSTSADPPQTNCPPDRDFDIASWSDGGDFSAQVAAVRQSVTGELDEADFDKVIGLARLYIFFGFGTEAVAALDAFGISANESHVARGMANIFENSTIESPSTLKSFENCAGAASFWAFLDGGSFARMRLDDKANLLRYFSNLGAEHRRMIGPKLGLRLLAVGERELAASVRDVIIRASGDSGVAFEYFSASLEFLDGRRNRAAARLTKLVVTRAENASNALILLLTEMIAAAEPVSAQLLQDTALLTYQFQGTETGRELLLLGIIAQANAGEGKVALKRLRDEILGNWLSQEHAKSIAQKALKAAALSKMTNEGLAELYFANRELFEADESFDAVRRLFATRLGELGLENTVLEILTPMGDRLTDADQELAAMAFVAGNQSKTALDVLSGVHSDRASDIRARSFAQQGDYQFAAAEKTGQEAEYLWNAGSWDVLRQNAAPLRMAAAAYMSGSKVVNIDGPDGRPTQTFGALIEPVFAPENASIAASSDLLNTSQESRDYLSRLLDEFPGPEEN